MAPAATPATTPGDGPPPLAHRYRWLALAALVVVPVALSALTFVVIRQVAPEPELPTLDGDPFAVGLRMIVTLVVAAGHVGLGIVLLGVAQVTNLFIGRFDTPVLPRLKRRRMVADVVVGITVLFGVGLAVTAFLGPALEPFGIPWATTLRVFGLGFVIVASLVYHQIDTWGAVEERIIALRLGAKGIGAEPLARGTIVSVSDPTKSSFKKVGGVADDVGMLWLEREQLLYLGDTQELAIPRDDLLAIERDVDPGSLTALAGNRSVVLRFRGTDGAEVRRRINPHGDTTIWSVARTSDAFAARLQRWRDGSAGPDPEP